MRDQDIADLHATLEEAMGHGSVELRTPKARQHRITATALEAFEAGDWIALHRALGLRPWQPSPLDAATPEAPEWAGRLDAWREGWPLARELRAELINYVGNS